MDPSHNLERDLSESEEDLNTHDNTIIVHTNTTDDPNTDMDEEYCEPAGRVTPNPRSRDESTSRASPVMSERAARAAKRSQKGMQGPDGSPENKQDPEHRDKPSLPPGSHSRISTQSLKQSLMASHRRTGHRRVKRTTALNSTSKTA